MSRRILTQPLGGAVQNGLVQAKELISSRNRPRKNKPKNKKKKSAKKRPVKFSGVKINRNSNFFKQACAILDPFCPHAYGAKLPGSNGTMTVPLTARNVVSVSTSTTAAKAFFFYPDWNYGYATATSGGTSFLLPALTAFDFGGTGAGTYIYQGRVVSAGFRIRNTSAAQIVQGSVWCVPIGTYQDNGAATVADPPPLTDPRTIDIGAAKEMEIAVVALRRGTGAYDFHVSLDYTAATQPDNQVWMVYFPLTSDVNTYVIEYVVHVEGTLVNSQNAIMAITGINSNNAIHPGVTIVADKVSSKFDGVVSRVSGGASDVLSKIVEQKVEQALAYAGDYFLGATEMSMG